MNTQMVDAALRRLVELNEQLRALTAGGYHQDFSERLACIERDIAFAQDALNRARAGAPPAPADYDPQARPHLYPLPSSLSGVVLRPNSGRKLADWEMVREMRRQFNEDGLSVIALKRDSRYNHLSESAIRDIINNRTWYDDTYVRRPVKRGRYPG
jgi:hypothetical protein